MIARAQHWRIRETRHFARECRTAVSRPPPHHIAILGIFSRSRSTPGEENRAAGAVIAWPLKRRQGGGDPSLIEIGAGSIGADLGAEWPASCAALCRWPRRRTRQSAPSSPVNSTGSSPSEGNLTAAQNGEHRCLDIPAARLSLALDRLVCLRGPAFLRFGITPRASPWTPPSPSRPYLSANRPRSSCPAAPGCPCQLRKRADGHPREDYRSGLICNSGTTRRNC